MVEDASEGGEVGGDVLLGQGGWVVDHAEAVEEGEESEK